MFFDCDKCALHKNGKAVSGEGPKPSDIMIIGMCPGPEELKQGNPFVGPSGVKLNSALQNAKLNRSELYITNVVKCFNSPGKELSKTFIRICGDEYLKKEIEEVKPKVIIILGQTACKFFGERYITNSHFYEDKYNCYIVVTHHPSRLLRTYSDKLHLEFKEAFILAKSLVDKKEKKTEATSKYIETISMEDLIPLENEAAYDLETTGLDFMKDRILSVGLSNGTYSIGFPFNDHNKDILGLWIKDKYIIGHNIKFDYKFSKMQGIDFTPYFDTMLAHFLIDRDASHGLKEIALKYLHTKMTKGTIDFDSPLVDMEERCIYAANDAYMTYEVYHIFKPVIEEQYKGVFFNIMMPTLEWLANAEFRGIKVNREYLTENLNSFKYRLISIEKEVKENPTVKDFCKRYGLEEFNLKSPKQISDLLYNYLNLKTVGLKNTNEETLVKLVYYYPENLFLKKIVEYRHVYKSYRTYIQNLLTFSEFDNRIHCEYNQTRVPSGRLSSSEPNLQNLPKDDDDESDKSELAKILKKAFIPTEGYSLLEIDYKQAEFRALAHYSKDIHMIDMINEGRDIHRVIAAYSYLKKEEDVTDRERKIAKTIVFGLMYGRGSKSIAEQLQIPIEEANNIKNNFFNTFKQAAKWIYSVQEFAKQNGYIKTLTGRKVGLPFVYSKDKEEVAYALRCAINYPIQGVAADMTNLGGALLYNEFKQKGLESYVIMNIHDAVVVECKKELVNQIKPIIKEMMEAKVKEDLGLRVKLEVDIKEGQNLAFTE